MGYKGLGTVLSMTKRHLIFNPASDTGRTEKKVDKVESWCQANDVVFSVTDSPGHASLLALDDQYDIVGCMGGDGTIHETINGLMKINEEIRPSFVALGSGTGNDFLYGLNLKHSWKEGLELFFSENSISVDIGDISINNQDKIFFANVVGIGFDAAVAISTKTSILPGFAKYLAATIETILTKFVAPNFKIVLDDEEFEEDVLMFVIGNGPREGGGFMTTPNSKMNDGLLEAVFIGKVSRLTMFRLLPKVMKGTHLNFPGVKLVQSTTFKLTIDHSFPIHVDGEIYADGKTMVNTVEVGVNKGAIQLLI